MGRHGGKHGGNQGGQPTKFTPARAQLIIESLSKHNYLSTSCELANIDENTLYNWLDKAEKYIDEDNQIDIPRIVGTQQQEEERLRYVTFFADVKQARAGSEIGLLGRIDEAGSVSTLIEQRTINHALKDGSTKTEVIERWKPPDWTANAWILERTKYQKFGQHNSLDIQQAGVVFIERLQRARQQKVIEGEFKEIEDIAQAPHPIEIPPEHSLLALAEPRPATDPLNQEPRRRPIFELIASVKAKQLQNDTSQKSILTKLGSAKDTYKNQPAPATKQSLASPPDIEGSTTTKPPGAQPQQPAPFTNSGVEGE